MIKRTYSIASPPGLDHLEFYIKVVDDGEFTTLLDKAGEGAPVWLSDSIHGGFTLESVPTGKDIILVATGTGLAPYISMIRHGAGTGRWRRLVVVHGCCYADELGFRDLIEGIAADDPSVTYIPTVTREPEDSGWAGLRGRVQAIFETEAYERLVRAPLDPEQCHLFLCGNPQMIDDVEVVLGRLGFEHHTAEAPGNLHFERWW
jgi:ferredoxin--NADP+ reductase